MKTRKPLNINDTEAAEQLLQFVSSTLIIHPKDWNNIRKLRKLITKKAVR